jgi:hypothetical protein
MLSVFVKSFTATVRLFLGPSFPFLCGELEGEWVRLRRLTNVVIGGIATGC